MERLNYHHLFSFWAVARKGSLSAAGKMLHVTHPTLSAQVHALEDTLGEKLFEKVGRRLVLTQLGQVVFRYADEIFSLGRELVDTVKGHGTDQPQRLDIGVTDVVPKMIVRQLLEPALRLDKPVRLVCHENTYPKLLADLSMHTLDLVLTDEPLRPGTAVRAYSHLLGASGVGLFGTKALTRTHRRRFPQSLEDAPLLLPLENLPLRRALDQWFESRRIRPRVVAEFEDSALLKVFGADGVGMFPAPLAVAERVCQQYGVQRVGHFDGIVARFYAISIERRLQNPAVVAICEAARHELFGHD